MPSKKKKNALNKKVVPAVVSQTVANEKRPRSLFNILYLLFCAFLRVYRDKFAQIGDFYDVPSAICVCYERVATTIIEF